MRMDPYIKGKFLSETETVKEHFIIQKEVDMRESKKKKKKNYFF
jgi:hypothetical protein